MNLFKIINLLSILYVYQLDNQPPLRVIVVTIIIIIIMKSHSNYYFNYVKFLFR